MQTYFMLSEVALRGVVIRQKCVGEYTSLRWPT